jgi:hypothetical protein
MGLSKSDIEQLRNRLPHGYQAMIQARMEGRGSKVSKQTVSYVLTGKQFREDVLVAAIEVAEEHEAKMLELARRARGKRLVVA